MPARSSRRFLKRARDVLSFLFTSYSQMEQVYQTLKSRLPFPVLLQGEKSKSGLLDSFRNTPNAVLFATSSFWQGVDVQGEQLSCVVIDKLPFSVPSDPVTAARIAQINESGGNAFYDYQIPTATILLKQGMGRLIRSKTDRGILGPAGQTHPDQELRENVSPEPSPGASYPTIPVKSATSSVSENLHYQLVAAEAPTHMLEGLQAW